MFKQSGHKVIIKMHDNARCELILCNKDVELLIEEWNDKDSRVLKVEGVQNDEDDPKYTGYLNKDLIRDIEVY